MKNEQVSQSCDTLNYLIDEIDTQDEHLTDGYI